MHNPHAGNTTLFFFVQHELNLEDATNLIKNGCKYVFEGEWCQLVNCRNRTHPPSPLAARLARLAAQGGAGHASYKRACNASRAPCPCNCLRYPLGAVHSQCMLSRPGANMPSTDRAIAYFHKVSRLLTFAGYG